MVSELLYADDAVIIAPDEGRLQNVTYKWSNKVVRFRRGGQQSSSLLEGKR